MRIFLSVIGFSALLFLGYKIVETNSVGRQELASSVPLVDIPRDLLQGSKDFLAFVQNPQGLTASNCSSTLDEIYADLVKIDPAYFDRDRVKENHKEIIHHLFQSRSELRKKLRRFVEAGELKPKSPEPACVTSIRNINRAARFLEDYLGENFLGVKTYDEKKDPKAFGTLTGDEPWLLKADRGAAIGIRSGDILISRGNAFTSAAIARIGLTNAQFSHLAMIYIKGDSSGRIYSLDEAKENPNTLVLEAHIEVGSTIRTFKDYLEDGNARNAQYRFFDAKKAHSAAEFSFNLITTYRQKAYADFKASLRSKANPLVWGMDISHPDFAVPYDFKMNLENHKEVFCSEVGYWGFKNENVIIPQFPSVISPASENDLVRTLGVTGPQIFAPGDMELDTRFEMLAEWRDYRKMKSVRHKDAILDSMFGWMKAYDYKLHPQFYVSAGAQLIWMLRWVDLPKIQVGKKTIFDVSQKLPKNMAPGLAATVTVLNTTADALGKELLLREEAYQKANPGFLFVYKDILKELDLFREKDLMAYKGKGKSAFHHIFRPNSKNGAQ